MLSDGLFLKFSIFPSSQFIKFILDQFKPGFIYALEGIFFMQIFYQPALFIITIDIGISQNLENWNYIVPQLFELFCCYMYFHPFRSILAISVRVHTSQKLPKWGHRQFFCIWP
ncbi:hypothetical protein CX648_11980 [Aeromonas dhakensis]|nr:hypothetical protein CX648_11980 [Aeromonas dhakensis]